MFSDSLRHGRSVTSEKWLGIVGKDVAYLGKRLSWSNWAETPRRIMGRLVTVCVTISTKTAKSPVLSLQYGHVLKGLDMHKSTILAESKCPTCGEPSNGPCSQRCLVLAWEKVHPEATTDRTLRWCPQCFNQLPEDARTDQRFCSALCRKRYSRRRSDDEPINERRCDQCLRPLPIGSRRNKRYCCDGCRMTAMRWRELGVA